MALGMKHWIGLVVAGCAAVALQGLPPAPLEIPQRDAPLPAEARLHAMTRRAALANAQLLRVRWGDEYIARTLSDDGPLAFGAPDGVDPVELERVHESALRTLDELGPQRADVAIGLFYASMDDDAYPQAAPILNLGSADYYFGERDGQAYCTTVVPVLGRRGRFRLPSVGQTTSRLGVCQLVARYGLPGPAVTTWLADGGTALALTLEPSQESHFSFSAAWASQLERRSYMGLVEQSPLSRRLGIDRQRCFAGAKDGCANVFARAGINSYYSPWGNYRLADALKETPVSAVQQRSILEPADQRVAADLAAQFGEERFRAWWTAEGSVEEAFQDAFGTDAGSWYQARVAKLIPVARRGPAPTGTGLLGVLLLLGLGMTVGGAWSRGRTVA